MPSVQEGFGIVLLEAAASGLPVVAGNADGSPDALADGGLGRLVDPHDQTALVQAIDAMLGAAAQDRALLERYDFAHFAERAAMLVDALLASGKPAPPRAEFLEAS